MRKRNSKPKNGGPIAPSPRVWLRIDAATMIQVRPEQATPEFASLYRQKLADSRGRFHRYD